MKQSLNRRQFVARSIAAGAGLATGLNVLAGIAANNDFSSPMPEFRECQIALLEIL